MLDRAPTLRLVWIEETQIIQVYCRFLHSMKIFLKVFCRTWVRKRRISNLPTVTFVHL